MRPKPPLLKGLVASHAKLQASEDAQKNLNIQEAKFQEFTSLFQVTGTIILWGVGGFCVISGWILHGIRILILRLMSLRIV